MNETYDVSYTVANWDGTTTPMTVCNGNEQDAIDLLDECETSSHWTLVSYSSNINRDAYRA